MARRLLTLSLTLVLSMTFLNMVCHAESRLLTRHMRDTVSYGEARQVGHLPAAQTMRLVLALPLRNEADLDSFLEDLYDPTSSSYRQFLTVEEFTAKYGANFHRGGKYTQVFGTRIRNEERFLRILLTSQKCMQKVKNFARLDLTDRVSEHSAVDLCIRV